MICQNRIKMDVGAGGEESRGDRKMISWSDFPHVLCLRHHLVLKGELYCLFASAYKILMIMLET